MRTTFPPSNARMKRINLIALGVFVLLVVAVFFFDTKTTRAIQSTVLSIFGVAHKAADAVSGDGFTVDGEDYTPDGLMKRFTHEELAEEHSKLVRESNELRFFKQRLDIVQQENNQLRDAIGFKRGYYMDLIAARVIKRRSATWWNTMMIDKGDDDGIVLESPVLSQSGALIGKVISTQLKTARVLLLTDESCRVAASVEGRTEKGILMGTRSVGSDVAPKLVLKYLSKEAVLLPPGKTFGNFSVNVLSSGVYRFDENDKDADPEPMGVFPEGLKIGVIESFKTRELYGEAVVRPIADFTNITDVFVIEPDDPNEVEDGDVRPAVPVPVPVPVPMPEPAVPVVEGGVPSATPVAPPSAPPVETPGATPVAPPVSADPPGATPVTPDAPSTPPTAPSAVPSATPVTPESESETSESGETNRPGTGN